MEVFPDAKARYNAYMRTYMAVYSKNELYADQARSKAKNRYANDPAYRERILAARKASYLKKKGSINEKEVNQSAK